MLEAILLKFVMWSTEIGGRVHSKIGSFCKDSTELRMHENHVFFLPVSILMVLRAGFLGHTTHYHVL